jgi:CHRD domain
MRVHVAAILLFALVITAITGLRAHPTSLASRASSRQGPNSPVSQASSGQAFKGRLSPVPISADMVGRITGSGSFSGELTGNTLTIAGLFTGLQSPATLAHLHIGERTGVRGPAVFDVRLDKATTGSLSATIELSESQIASLRRGFFYLQINSEKAADGNLWGWLLAEDKK